MLNAIPFEMPAKFAADLAAGELVRYGAILKSPVTGQIVGHLQETGLGQSLLANAVSAASMANPATGIANLATNAYTSYKVTQVGAQVSQLQGMVQTLQSLQVATAGLSLVGGGVSVAGFLYMRKRFDALDGQFDRLADIIRTGIDDLRKSALRAQMSKTKGLLQRAKRASEHADPVAEYRNVAAALADQAAFFEGEASNLLTAREEIPSAALWQLVQALVLCNNVRIDCWIRSNDLNYTLGITSDVASEYEGLFLTLSPLSFDVSPEKGLDIIRVLRDITDSAASKPYLIDHLRTRRIAGPEYLAALEREQENPLLILKAG